jgi:uncharacterized protein YbjQ (UPF0145 family)
LAARKEEVAMQEDKSCKACGAPLPLNAQFCIQCGAGVTEAGIKPDAGAAARASTALTTVDGVLVVSANWIPGYNLLETRGFIYGLTVRSRGLGRNIAAGLRSLAGGEIREYVEMMQHARDEALYRMVEHAKSVGANGVISAYFDSSEISDYMQEILAYGTAVVISKK